MSHIEQLEWRGFLSAAVIATLPAEVHPQRTAVVGDHFYFTSLNLDPYRTVYSQIWRSDGTAAGTFAVTHAAAPSVKLALFGEVTLAPLGNGKLAVLSQGLSEADDAQQLWIVDDATAKASEAAWFELPAFGYKPTATVLNGVLIFAGKKHGDEEIWRSDGTAGGTFMLKDIEPSISPAPASSNPDQFVTAGSHVFFTATTAANGTELYVTDGTAAGTRLVKDLSPGKNAQGTVNSAAPFNVTPVGERVFFTVAIGDTADDGRQIWSSDGTEKGTALLGETQFVDDITQSSDGKLIYYRATDDRPADISTGLWRSDGTPAGTFQLFKRGVSDLHAYGGKLDFAGFQANGDSRRFSTDGTPAGTVQVELPFNGGFYQTGQWPTAFNGSFVFSAAQTPDEYGLWVTDGTYAGNRKVADAPLADGFVVAAGKVFMYTSTTSDPSLLSVYDPSAGTLAGTVFNDRDANGVRDASEKPLVGYTVFIDRNNDGVLGGDEPSTKSSSTGRYHFDLLPAGKYTVRIIGIEGRRGSTPDRFRVRLGADATVTRNFGRTDHPLLAGIVYMDANKNGTFDAGEAGMIGWTAFIDLDHDGVLDLDEPSVITDAAGKFALSAPAAGTFQVRVVGQSGYRLIAPGSGYRKAVVGVGAISSKLNFGEKRLK